MRRISLCNTPECFQQMTNNFTTTFSLKKLPKELQLQNYVPRHKESYTKTEEDKLAKVTLTTETTTFFEFVAGTSLKKLGTGPTTV